MKLSLNWLKEFTTLPNDLTAEKLAYDLTMSTVEVESITDLGSSFELMVIGQVKELRKHPNADKLRIAITDIGDGEHKEIVCGGSNLEEEMLVAVAKPGSRVRWHGEGDLITLGEAKIRGVKSFGMICASTEIGLGDLYPLKDEHEVIHFQKLDAKPGTPLADALGLNDWIIDIDNKSLTNRPDLWGHYGMARELAAIYGSPLKPLPDFQIPDIDDEGVKIFIHEPELCPRYTGVIVEGVKVEQSPLWMQTRLMSVGQRPINFIVDLTNYVMFAVGQPSHAFDCQNVEGSEIHVRLAKEGETLTLLDGSERELSPSMLVVADREKPSALAGVMGGLGSGITESTTELLLEIGNWEPTQVRRTATVLGVRTESSSRFDKGLDAARVEQGAKLLLAILSEIQPGIKVRSWQDHFPTKPQEIHVQVSREFINSRIGMELSSSEITQKLERLGFVVDYSNDAFRVLVPSWRATGDVSLPEDLVEEVARMIGYDNLPFVPPSVSLCSAVRQPYYLLDRFVREYLSGCGGMSEIYTYPWMDDQFVAASRLADLPAYSLHEPSSETSTRLKNSLIPNILQAVSGNARYFKEFSLFEVSRVFLVGDSSEFSGVGENLPVQPKWVCGAKAGASAKEVYLELKGILQDLFESCSVLPVVLDLNGDFSSWVSPGTGIAICTEGKQIGELGLLARPVANRSDIERLEVALFEFDLDALVPMGSLNGHFHELPKYPRVDYDLALLFDSQVPWSSILTEVRSADKLIHRVEFLEEYQGKQIPDGKKSIAFQMTIGHLEKTLTSDEVESVAEKVLTKLRRELGGELRER